MERKLNILTKSSFCLLYIIEILGRLYFLWKHEWEFMGRKSMISTLIFIYRKKVIYTPELVKWYVNILRYTFELFVPFSFNFWYVYNPELLKMVRLYLQLDGGGHVSSF